jgi:hypothetical protein
MHVKQIFGAIAKNVHLAVYFAGGQRSILRFWLPFAPVVQDKLYTA